MITLNNRHKPTMTQAFGVKQKIVFDKAEMSKKEKNEAVNQVLNLYDYIDHETKGKREDYLICFGENTKNDVVAYLLSGKDLKKFHKKRVQGFDQANEFLNNPKPDGFILLSNRLNCGFHNIYKVDQKRDIKLIDIKH